MSLTHSLNLLTHSQGRRTAEGYHERPPADGVPPFFDDPTAGEEEEEEEE
jgi:hypothetical protein